MMKITIAFFFVITVLTACNEQKKPVVPFPAKRDTAITTANAFSPLFFDTLQLEHFIATFPITDSSAVLMRDFYNVRNYEYGWFDKTGLTEQAAGFLNLLRNYIAYSGDSSILDPRLSQLKDSLEQGKTGNFINDSLRLRIELELTHQFLVYASHAYEGGEGLDPKDVKWFIPRRKVSILTMLDSIVTGKGKNITDYEPVNRQYPLLREFLSRYGDIRRKGSWETIPLPKTTYRRGDTGQAIVLLRKRLRMTGDYTANDTTAVFTDSLKKAVEHFQSRMGITPDGIAGTTTVVQLNIPVNERIRQILVNMERLKWVPAQPSGDYLLVNIPEYKLHAYENGQYAFNMDVVVGSEQHRTVVFTGQLKYVVFSPYWNIPPGILKNEVLPGIKKDTGYLEQHNMEWNNGKVRQKPGPDNSLGLVKFLFPNSYNIYLHDTPAKSLFNETARAFSHGCIRVSKPEKLAEWVLRKDSTWDGDKIYRAMHLGRERFVTVKNDIAVFIGYFTAWVDRDGKLNFRKDIYGHDTIMAQKMFTE